MSNQLMQLAENSGKFSPVRPSHQNLVDARLLIMKIAYMRSDLSQDEYEQIKRTLFENGKSRNYRRCRIIPVNT